MAALTILTAADTAYANYALNLIASIQENAATDAAIRVYDLGLTAFDRRLFGGIQGVELHPVEPFVPHWRACWSWKPWIWQDAPEGDVLYLDAGVSAIRPLGEIRSAIERDGYFLVTQGYPSARGIPEDYYDRFSLDRSVGSRDMLAAGIVGFRKPGPFYREVVSGVLKGVKAGYNLGWSESELARNTGINRLEPPIIRECPEFRHDQTLLTIEAYRWKKDLHVHPLEKYAGWQSPQDHPQQIIWHHRRVPTLPYLGRLRYDSRVRHALSHVALQVRRRLR